MKLYKHIAIYFVVAVLSLAGCKKKAPEGEQPYLKNLKNLSADSFALVFTSSMEGYVEPCGCTSSPLGGIDRFARVFQETKVQLQNRLSLIDSGNLLFEFPSRNPADHCQDKARVDLLVSTLSSLGLRITFPGPLDDSLGSEYRDSLYKKYALTPLATDGLQFINTPNYDIAIIGVTKIDAKIQAKLKNDLEKVKENKKVKLTILFSQLELENTKSYFSNADYIDVVIQSRVDNMDPKRAIALGEKGPILVEGGRQGQNFTFLLLQNLAGRASQKIALDNRAFDMAERLDLLKLRLNGLTAQKVQGNKARLEFIENRIAKTNDEIAELTAQKAEMPPMDVPNIRFLSIAIEKSITPEPQVEKKLHLYNKSIPQLVKTCEENIECPRPNKNEATYVGATTCKSCHEAAYKVWQNAIFSVEGTDEKGNKIQRKTGHAKAWKTLVEQAKDADRSCVGCHSIGFMKAGGYCKVSQVDFRKDVQCESCHGAGSLHAQSGNPKLISRAVGEETCRGCHHVPHIESPESFNYEEKLKKILGPGHGEKLLKQLEHKAK